MVEKEYIQKVEQACNDLMKEGEKRVRAGRIAERANVDDSSLLGMRLTFGVLEFEGLEYDVIRHDSDSVSNEYRFY
ncbi:hypothetical protein [Halohasta litorea]|uniref:Uncharacterized protein n=1 Tax=Halohasta litorea TaxID=869891 RepID=A0ABD6D8R8_9EURY|nr:hypothetical protein [Halohasta litorea]